MAITHPRIGVVVVNYFSVSLLASLEALVEHVEDVVVVDNSNDETEWSRVVSACEGMGARPVHAPRNLGFGRGCNLGARSLTDVDYVLMLNPDAVISPTSLASLVSESQVLGPKTIVGATLVGTNGGVVHAFTYLDLNGGHAGHCTKPQDGTSLPWITGACMLVSRETWNDTGGFDPDYFLYWEDVDLCVRATRSGATLAISDARAFHAVGGTHEGKRGRSRAYLRHMTRSRLVFASKHLSARGRARWLMTSPIELARTARGAGLHRGETPLWRFLTACGQGLYDGTSVMLRASRRRGA